MSIIDHLNLGLDLVRREKKDTNHHVRQPRHRLIRAFGERVSEREAASSREVNRILTEMQTSIM